MDTHHIFVKAKEPNEFFEKAGIIIHDPQNLTWWESKAYRDAAKAYSLEWAKFIGNNQNATQVEINLFANQLMKKFGF